MKTALQTLAMLLTLFVGACASHPPKIDCDGHLKPINVPSPKPPPGAQP